MDEQLTLGEFEELVLMAVGRLGSDAYGVTIKQEVESATEKPSSYGAIYTILERLEKKGYVRSWMGEPTNERGGRAKKYFQVEGAGERALDEADRRREAAAQARTRLRQGWVLGFMGRCWSR